MINYINERFIKKNRLELLFVGGLDRAHYFKGFNVMLDALAGLAAANWRLTVVGDGELRPSYAARAAALGLEKKISWAGRVSEADKIRAYQNADLLLLPSINSNEAFGFVLIEALACGVPVIAADLPGVRRVFSDRQEGLLANLLGILLRKTRSHLENKPHRRAVVPMEKLIPSRRVTALALADKLSFRY